jgi:hypothetical protein
VPDSTILPHSSMVIRMDTPVRFFRGISMHIFWRIVIVFFRRVMMLVLPLVRGCNVGGVAAAPPSFVTKPSMPTSPKFAPAVKTSRLATSVNLSKLFFIGIAKMDLLRSIPRYAQ